MPEELKKYFWDTKFEKLDIQKNKRYIICILYCYGYLKALRWVKENYSNEDIEDVARNCRNLKPLVANYLRQQFNLKKEEVLQKEVKKYPTLAQFVSETREKMGLSQTGLAKRCNLTMDEIANIEAANKSLLLMF